MTTKADGSPARPEQARRQARRWLWLAAGVVAVALGVVTGMWWLGASRPEETLAGAPVEQFMHVHGLAIPAWAPEAVFLSTHHGLIRIDAEASEWRFVSEEPHDFMGFSAHPTADGTLFSSGHPAPASGLRNPIGFMVSTDAGVSWEPRSLEGVADFHAMTVGADGQVVYGWNVAGQPGLYRSVDEGHTWETVEAAGLHEAGGALALAAHPANAEVVLAGAEAGLLASRDGGATWEPLLDAGVVTAVAFDPTDPDRLLAYSAGPGEGMVESRDSGRTWTATGWRLEGDAVGHLAIHPNQPDVVYAGTYGESLYRSEDGRRSFEPLAEDGRPH